MAVLSKKVRFPAVLRADRCLAGTRWRTIYVQKGHSGLKREIPRLLRAERPGASPAHANVTFEHPLRPV